MASMYYYMACYARSCCSISVLHGPSSQVQVNLTVYHISTNLNTLGMRSTVGEGGNILFGFIIIGEILGECLP